MQKSNHQETIMTLADMLDDKIQAPEWASYVKTGHGKQRPPTQDNWWNIRAASVLMKVQKLGPIGVSKLSVKYGTRKNRGVQPEIHTNGSRNILRKILQQLESNKLVEQVAIKNHKGRKITTAGLKLINEASKKTMKN